MNTKEKPISTAELDRKTSWFTALCRKAGLKVTPQRIAIYRELIKSDEHPSAEMLHAKVRRIYPNISLDTVNRTLLTLSEIGAAIIVEGSGDAKRFDGELEKHQHFKCVRCKRVVDFHHERFDNIVVPAEIEGRFTVLRKSVYLEGICDMCN
ncbi:MAG: transcriptional repressor [Phycisphaerales bacterium]|nr:MAG: transcriptional repressor [Phycisphaerales bacterium]